MNKSDILSGFNNHLHEFFNDVVLIFPNNTDIRVAQSSLLAMRKANPKLIISVWKKQLEDPYGHVIREGNIDFFINKNYKEDLKDHGEGSDVILEKINSLKEPVSQMGEDNLSKTIVYLQNLTKLCNLYYS